MSVKSAKAFLNRMKTDDCVAKKVTGCKNATARMALVKTEGYDFSAKDLKTARTTMSRTDLERINAPRNLNGENSLGRPCDLGVMCTCKEGTMA